MKSLYILLFLPVFAYAQVEQTGGQACRLGKIHSLERQATNPKARLAYPGDASIDITYYGLDLRLTVNPAGLRGATTITLKSTTASLNSFFLDLNSTTSTLGAGLRVDSVKVGNQMLAFQHAQNKLTITPSQPLTTGQALTFTVFYQGVPNGGPQGSFGFENHDTTTDPVIWSLSEPYGASDWFPCRDTPADKADSSSVSITAPAQFVSVSNGKLISTTNNTDGTRTYLWKNSYPIAQYLISIAVSNYAQYDTPFNYGNQSLPVTHYIYPENLDRFKANLALTPAMLQLFTNRYGAYPFLREKYGHAEFPLRNGGMEHQTISSMGSSSLTPYVIAHELTHQWFGDKITCRDWQNIWLNEGFASYGEALYAESISQQTYRSYMNNFFTGARKAVGSLYVQDISSINSIFNESRTYDKGAAVVHMLRGVVGDSTFFRILRTYTATPTLAYQTAVTEDFQAVAQQVSSVNLDYFFKQWVYGEGYPNYKSTVTINGNTATIRLVQNNATATNPAFFTMPVQLTLQSAAGDTTLTVLNNQADQTFTLPARGTVTNVIVDSNNWILKTLDQSTTTNPTTPTNPTNPTNPTTVVTAVIEPTPPSLRVYPNPTTETVTVDFSVSTTGPIAVSLTDLLGRKVRTLRETIHSSGDYSRTINLRGLSSGSYTLTLETPTGLANRRILVR